MSISCFSTITSYLKTSYITIVSVESNSLRGVQKKEKLRIESLDPVVSRQVKSFFSQLAELRSVLMRYKLVQYWCN